MLMVAIAIFSISGSAEARNTKTQDESPWVPSGSEPAAVADASVTYSADEIPEGKYYIRCSEAGAFFAGGNSWGTRLSLKSAGDLISVTKKSGTTDAYILKDVSLVDASTGSQIGEPGDSKDLFIDQTAPASGYKFHKLTADEVKAVDAEFGSNFANGVGKDYYYIFYTNRENKLVYLTQDVPAESNHSQVSGIAVASDENMPPVNAIWEILTREELAQDLIDNATHEFFMSATPFFVNPDFSRNYGSASNCGWTIDRPISDIGGAGNGQNFIASATYRTFNIYQTITDLPNGDYGIIAYGVYDGDKNGDGTNPRFYVKDANQTQYKTFKHQTTVFNRDEWSLKFISKNTDELEQYRLDTIKVTVWDNTLTIGFEGGRSDVNAYFDNVQILYYGPSSNISSLNTKFNNLRTQGTNIINQNKPMGADIKAALKEALSLAPNSQNAQQLNSAIATLSKAITAAQNSQKLYGELASKYQTEVDKLSAEAQALYKSAITDAIINQGKLTDEDQLLSGLNAAKIVDNGVGEITELMITNPSFETGDYSGWTLGDGGGDTGAKDNTNGTYKMSGSDGHYVFNTWINGGGTPIHQTLKGLAPGTYTLTALMASTRNNDESYNWLHLNAGEEDMVSNPSQVQQTGVDMVLNFSVDEISNVEIYAWASAGEGATLFGDDHVWYKVDNVHLIYNGKKNLDEYITELQTQLGNADALLKMKMNADVELDLRNSRKTGQTVSHDDEAGLKAAIADLKAKNKAAQASVTIYSNISTIIEKGNSLDNAGKTAFTEFVKDIQNKWSNGEITDGTTELQSVQSNYIAAIKQQDTPGKEMTEAVADWQCNSGYKTGQFGWGNRAEAVVKDWEIYDYDKTEIVSLNSYFHVNTWSTEAELGQDGGTPMTNPFTEFWSSADENYLGNHHLKIYHKGETGYRPGRYTISIIARLAQCETGAYRPKGYKFVANNIESTTNYKLTDKGVFWESDEIDFFVEENGNIDFWFELDHPNFSWLAFKMIKLVYQGETYSDEQVTKLTDAARDKYIGQIMNKDVETELIDAINAFKENHSIANGKALKEAESKAQESMNLFEDITEQIDTYVAMEAEYDNGKGFEKVAHDHFEDAIAKINKKYEDRTLTAEDDGAPKQIYHEFLISQQSGDFTSLIDNPGFEDGVGKGWTWDGGTDVGVKSAYGNATYETWVDNCKEGEAPLYNYVFNTWSDGEVGGIIKQTIHDIPNGKYRVSAYVASYNTNYVFVFGNDEHSAPTNNSKYNYDDAKRHATKAEVEVKVTNRELTIGAIGGTGMEFPDYPTEKGCWYKVDAFQLEYLGPIDNEDLLNQLKSTCEWAEPYTKQDMNKDSLALLKNVYDEAIKQTAASDANYLTELNSMLKEYVNHTLSSIEIYKGLNEFFIKANALDEAGLLKFNQLAKDVITAYDNGDITDGKHEADVLEDVLRIATKYQTSEHTDWTGAIYNPSFENKGAHWGTRTDISCKPLENAKVSGDGTVRPWSKVSGTRYAYRNNTASTPIAVNYQQRIDSVPSGLYKMRATVYTNSKTMTVFGNNLNSYVASSASPDDAKEVEQLIIVQTNESSITIGVNGTLKANEEFRIDNFRLEYISEKIDISSEAVPDDVPMNNTVKANQALAILKFKMNPQPNVVTAAIEAIKAAKESAEYYATALHYYDSCKAYMAKSNVYTADMKAKCDATLATLKEGLDNGSYDNNDIKKMLYAIFQNGFENFTYSNASDPEVYTDYPVLKYMFDAWTYKKYYYDNYVWSDGNFKVNNWSEHVSKTNPTAENSQMTTPYMEYWRNSNEGPLEDATIHAKAIDLEKGYLYSVKVLTRVLNENNSIAPDEFQGVRMHVTTDRTWHNNGIPVSSTDTINLCDGEIHRDDAFNVVSQEFEIDSIVVRTRENGEAHVYFTIEDANVNWFNWKFCQFVRGRQLKDYEEDDPATDEQIAELWKLIKRDEKKSIGFNVSEYSTYMNRDLITAHNFAKKYLTEKSGKTDGYNNSSYFIVDSLINILKDESKWITQNEDINCVHNANFALVKNNGFAQLYGWSIDDPSVEHPLTGGIGATSTTAEQIWTKFTNAGSLDFDGNENTYSTAARFIFDKPNYFCSSNSVYSYGSELGYEMPLDPGQAYTFSAQIGYLSEGHPGTITFEIRNARTKHVVKTYDYTPTTCVSDTTKIPEVFQIIFDTQKTANTNYNNYLENFDKLEMYELVVKNTDPSVYWTMVISNIKLYRWPNARMYIAPNAHWGTFIAPFDAKIPEGVAAYVVTGKDETSHPYKDPETGFEGVYTSLHINTKYKDVVYEKLGSITRKEGNMAFTRVIPAHTPVAIYTSKPEGYDGIASGSKAEERQGGVRWYRENVKSDSVYLEGHEGTPLVDNPTMMSKIKAQDGWYVLQFHKDELQACFYEVNTEEAGSPQIPANRCYLVDPTYKKSNGARIRRKIIFDLDDALEAATSIENSENQNQEIEILGIYSLDGTPQKTFKPGINIIKMTDGTTKKKFIK